MRGASPTDGNLLPVGTNARASHPTHTLPASWALKRHPGFREAKGPVGCWLSQP